MLEHFSSQEGESYVDILVEGTACSHYLRIRLTKMGVPFRTFRSGMTVSYFPTFHLHSPKPSVSPSLC